MPDEPGPTTLPDGAIVRGATVAAYPRVDRGRHDLPISGIGTVQLVETGKHTVTSIPVGPPA